MTEQETLTILTRILRDLVGDDSVELTMQTTRADVPAWDSFAYVNFIVAAEAEFQVKFRIADVESFADVGGIVTAIAAGQLR